MGEYRRAISAIAASLAALAMPSGAQAGAPAKDDLVGVWANPSHSVVVRTDKFSDTLTGHIIWASDTALADARESGVTKLVGTELLEDYHPDGSHGWKGIVYVPDMGRRFTSFISLIRPDMLRIRACLLGGLICRSQVWQRSG